MSLNWGKWAPGKAGLMIKALDLGAHWSWNDLVTQSRQFVVDKGSIRLAQAFANCAHPSAEVPSVAEDLQNLAMAFNVDDEPRSEAMLAEAETPAISQDLQHIANTFNHDGEPRTNEPETPAISGDLRAIAQVFNEEEH